VNDTRADRRGHSREIGRASTNDNCAYFPVLQKKTSPSRIHKSQKSGLRSERLQFLAEDDSSNGVCEEGRSPFAGAVLRMRRGTWKQRYRRILERVLRKRFRASQKKVA
jgi:hypothetical protein